MVSLPFDIFVYHSRCVWKSIFLRLGVVLRKFGYWLLPGTEYTDNKCANWLIKTRLGILSNCYLIFRYSRQKTTSILHYSLSARFMLYVSLLFRSYIVRANWIVSRFINSRMSQKTRSPTYDVWGSATHHSKSNPMRMLKWKAEYIQ